MVMVYQVVVIFWYETVNPLKDLKPALITAIYEEKLSKNPDIILELFDGQS